MQKTRYSEQPEPVLVEAIKGYVHITVAVNITQVESDPPAWEADTNRFWVPAGELDLDAVRQNPAAYLHRATHLSDARAEAKAKAKADKLALKRQKLEEQRKQVQQQLDEFKK